MIPPIIPATFVVSSVIVGATGIGNRTLILINMFGWNGERGVYLARKIAAHSRNGCVVRVISSRAGGKVTHILRSNGVQIKSPDADRNDNGRIDQSRLRPLGRLAGNQYSRPGEIFEMLRPKYQE